MKKPTYYTVIPAKIRYDKTLKANEKILYSEIKALCSNDSVCNASNKYFANLYNVSKDSISRWIRNLVDKGYIEVKVFFKDESKEVEKREIRIIEEGIDEKIDRYMQKSQTGIDEKVEENNIKINNISSSENELAENFEKIWVLYPRKDGKNSAFNHYKAWLNGKKYAGKKIKLTNKQMWYATKKYADLMVEQQRESRYIQKGSTFFNETIMEYVEDE